MLIDAEQVDAGQVVRSDLCIIGAGAAGITIARRLIPKGWRICLLESGGLDFEPDVQNLYAGPAGGTVLPSESAYLSRSRLRFFGGSTNHWTGVCRPLDEIDFTVRPWVPHSGWPFQKSALDAYYREAARIVQVPHFDQARDEGQQWGPGSVLTESGAFLTKQWHFSPPTRFAQRYRAELAAASDARVYLRGGPRNSDSLLRWDPDQGEGVWHATEETELSG